MKTTIVIFAVLFIPALAVSATIYVPDNYPTIQGAIDAALNGDTIIVRSGTYVENIDFLGKAITIKSEHGADTTTIDGNNAGTVVTCQSGENDLSVLDGFTITYGENLSGGGMYNLNSSPTVTNCIFNENWAFNGGGGGMYNENSSPTVTNCLFFKNSTGIQGLWEGLGGGIHNVNNSNPAIINSNFDDNYATVVGGGMYNENSNPTVTNCNFVENNGRYRGGGMANFSGARPTIINSIFVANHTMEYGGGIYNEPDSHIELTNCTFYGNSAQWGDGITNANSNPILTNCIVWDSTAIFNLGTSAPVVTFSNILGAYPGTGNINFDPQFVDAANNDIHLTYTSPCRDSGDNSAVTELYDFEGDPRIAWGGTVDMGADEFYTHLYITGDQTPGGDIQGKFVGLPGTSPVRLFIGLGGVRPTPLPTAYGDLWLLPPRLSIPLIPIPFNGILAIPTTIPMSPPAPYDITMQGLVGLNTDSLTNLCVLEVR